MFVVNIKWLQLLVTSFEKVPDIYFVMLAYFKNPNLSISVTLSKVYIHCTNRQQAFGWFNLCLWSIGLAQPSQSSHGTLYRANSFRNEYFILQPIPGLDLLTSGSALVPFISVYFSPRRVLVVREWVSERNVPLDTTVKPYWTCYSDRILENAIVSTFPWLYATVISQLILARQHPPLPVCYCFRMARHYEQIFATSLTRRRRRFCNSQESHLRLSSFETKENVCKISWILKRRWLAYIGYLLNLI